MSGEPDMLDDLEFENQINALGDDQPALIKFVARQQFQTGKTLVSHAKRLKGLESRNKKIFGAVGGAGALIAAVFIGIVEYFLKKGS